MEGTIPNENDHKPLKPTTTEQEDMTTAGQRKVNLIWENTQSKIALIVIIVGMLVNGLTILAILLYSKLDVTVNKLALISVCLQFINLTAGMVIGFYFSRTNHSAIGGIGKKPNEKYEGR